jgi:hypothetical protein
MDDKRHAPGDLDGLVKRLRGLADFDARAGEPLGKAMRDASDAIVVLRAWLAKAEAKRDALALDALAAQGQAADAYDAQLKAEAERDRLREALRFYAEGNWHGDYPGGVIYCGPTDAADFPTHLDYGNRARAALASKEGGE